MTPDLVVDLMREAIMILVMLVTVLIIPSLVIGVCVSTFQAATQINEQSLSFFPRLIATFLTLLLCSSWIVRVLTDFTQNFLESVPGLIG